VRDSELWFFMSAGLWGSSILCQKTCEIDWNSFIFYSTSFSVNFTRFLTQNRKYLRSPWMDFDEWWHFGNTLYNKKFSTNFLNFIANFDSKVEISWKLEEIRGVQHAAQKYFCAEQIKNLKKNRYFDRFSLGFW
jgi:hypothetical protein